MCPELLEHVRPQHPTSGLSKTRALSGNFMCHVKAELTWFTSVGQYVQEMSTFASTISPYRKTPRYPSLGLGIGHKANSEESNRILTASLASRGAAPSCRYSVSPVNRNFSRQCIFHLVLQDKLTIHTKKPPNSTSHTKMRGAPKPIGSKGSTTLFFLASQRVRLSWSWIRSAKFIACGRRDSSTNAYSLKIGDEVVPFIGFDGEQVDKFLDRLFAELAELMEMEKEEMENLSMEARLDTLEGQMEHVWNRPGGPGYAEAEADFQTLQNRTTTR
ncbi:hypothetical protein DFJ77DRAFT_440117 [Powellomyces hirtus]|nr:hypothetical protein DFJ77DRAFT_440117 [Powellomyces hirtus]